MSSHQGVVSGHRGAWTGGGTKEELCAFVDMGESNAGHAPTGWALVHVLERGLA